MWPLRLLALALSTAHADEGSLWKPDAMALRFFGAILTAVPAIDWTAKLSWLPSSSGDRMTLCVGASV